MNLELLRSKLLEEMAHGLPFMQGKEKGEIILGEVYAINEYGFLEGEDGEYIVFTINGNDLEFFFGGTVLTERFKKIESVFTDDEISALLNEGIKVIFEQKQSKNKRKYISVEFI